MKEEEEGERRIKPRHSLLHAVAEKENKQKTTEEEGEEGTCTHIQTPIYTYTVHIQSTCARTHTEIWRLVGNECGAHRLTEQAGRREREDNRSKHPKRKTLN